MQPDVVTKVQKSWAVMYTGRIRKFSRSPNQSSCGKYLVPRWGMPTGLILKERGNVVHKCAVQPKCTVHPTKVRMITMHIPQRHYYLLQFAGDRNTIQTCRYQMHLQLPLRRCEHYGQSLHNVRTAYVRAPSLQALYPPPAYHPPFQLLNQLPHLP
jgi:hypothetical protein